MSVTYKILGDKSEENPIEVKLTTGMGKVVLIARSPGSPWHPVLWLNSGGFLELSRGVDFVKGLQTDSAGRIKVESRLKNN